MGVHRLETICNATTNSLYLDSFDAVFQRMKDETKDLKAELRVLAPTRLSSQSSFNGGSNLDNNEKRLLHRRCALQRPDY